MGHYRNSQGKANATIASPDRLRGDPLMSARNDQKILLASDFICHKDCDSTGRQRRIPKFFPTFNVKLIQGINRNVRPCCNVPSYIKKEFY